MKVFVSWSGEASHDVAKALKDWLPNVIQAVDVFLSSEDIAKGSEWFHELGTVLDESSFGILCLTRDNLSAPWILYEAGALGKRFEQSRVVPLLIDITVPDLAGPLAHFNAALLDKGEITKLITAINAQLGENQLTEKQLDKVFQTWWPDLEKALQQAAMKAKSNSGKFTYDVFLSTPMAAFPTDAEYQAGRAQFKKLFDSLKQDCGLSVYWAAEKIESMSDFDTLDVSVLDDLKALQQSHRFVLVYPQKLVTSALFEAGYALALGRFSHYFVRDREDLPFLMRELAGPNSNVRIHADQDWKDYDDLAEKMAKYKDKWFGQ
ncbi:MAG: toll/interleukin-1 receptor domain-containing protein [Gammaproteobacteria bacterium]